MSSSIKSLNKENKIDILKWERKDLNMTNKSLEDILLLPALPFLMVRYEEKAKDDLKKHEHEFIIYRPYM